MEREKALTIRFVTVLIITLLMASVTLLVNAYFTRYSDEVKNIFNPADSIDPTIYETFETNADGNFVKENVYFEVGQTDYPVYVRAAIVVTWKDKDGIVYFKKPAQGTDYELKLKLEDDENDPVWVEMTNSDGAVYYYYIYKVQSGGCTPVLIESCEQIGKAPVDGYALSVEIIVQTVQAVGYTDGENGETVIPAYQDAWGISDSLSDNFGKNTEE